MEIHFHHESVTAPDIGEDKIRRWFEQIAESEKQNLGELNFIFCSDDYLLKINQEYLKHDYYTDIITFDYSDELISGDIFISLDRVRDNAKQLNESEDRELHRVMAHGVLHLIGYKDKTEAESREMRQKEEAALSLL